MGDRAHSDNIYHSFPPETIYILVLIFVQDHLIDMLPVVLNIENNH